MKNYNTRLIFLSIIVLGFIAFLAIVAQTGQWWIITNTLISLVLLLILFIVSLSLYARWHYVYSNRDVSVYYTNETILHYSAIPNDVNNLIYILYEELGFDHLGDYQTYRRDVTDAEQQPSPVMMYYHEGEQILATIDWDYKPTVIFRSIFADGFAVVTIYPQGAAVTTPHLASVVVDDSVEFAYEVHLLRVQQTQQRRGEPTTITSLTQVINLLAPEKDEYFTETIRIANTGELISDIAILIFLVYALIGLWAYETVIVTTAPLGVALLASFIASIAYKVWRRQHAVIKPKNKN